MGLPKSGTTTLGEALKQAGLRVADWRIRAGQSDDDRINRRFVGKLMYDGYFENGDPLSMMPEFDAFTEIDVIRNGLNLWPQCDWGLLCAIRDRYPNAKFILTYRDPAKLSDSMGRWSNMGRTRLPSNAIPGLPEGYGGTDAERIRWIEGHYAFCRKVFDDTDGFLEYDVEDEDAPNKVSRFLDLELPWWGVANANTRNQAEEARD
ncbi:sulfotransferase [Actibacterium lipolyticum]|uniref:sulfotransferase n=1 Tax=Actibacterium lipolyticum TaxID=1524263 RepID=UPI001F208451|nr:sulfotransferase [Actibacterium lipolyticum]